MNKHEIQLAIENQVTGTAFDANPISTLLTQALEQVFDRFECTPRWVRAVKDMGMEGVSFVTICALLEYTSEEGGVAQAHGVVGTISNRLVYMCEYDKKTRCLLAWNILHTCRECGLIRVTTTKGGEPTTVVSITSLFRELLDTYKLWGLCGLNRRPMVVPPIQHTLSESGGYLTGKLRKGVANGKWSAIKAMPVLDALNALQNTSWRINSEAMRSIEFLMQPYMEARETNKYAHDMALFVAQELEGHELWNPTYIDFRGRVGYQADILSPQGNDMSRGLLVYGKSIPITKEGWYWMRVHIANQCSGLPIADGKKIDKLSFDERVDWVDGNIETILDVGYDPIGHKELFWEGFGSKVKTFQCMTACIEAKNISETGMTCLPVTLDATCNNYQWFAGLLKDEDLARRTNVLPCDKPYDFHTDVADENARAWANDERDHDFIDIFTQHTDKLCDRKVGKNATLVIGYGGKRRGITSRLMGKKHWVNLGTEDEPQWTVGANPDSVMAQIDIPVDKQWHASFALAGDYETSLYAVAPSALEVTNFLRACVKVANDDNQCMEWLSPSGVLVRNHPNTKIEFNLTASELFDDQTSTQLKFTIFDTELNKRKAVSSAPPQYIHSMDASHLHYIVIDISKVTAHVSTVHDCFATHANFVGLLVTTVPTVFRKIIETNPLEVLAEVYEVECPEFGTLDTELVSQANYFIT